MTTARIQAQPMHLNATTLDLLLLFLSQSQAYYFDGKEVRAAHFKLPAILHQTADTLEQLTSCFNEYWPTIDFEFSNAQCLQTEIDFDTRQVTSTDKKRATRGDVLFMTKCIGDAELIKAWKEGKSYDTVLETHLHQNDEVLLELYQENLLTQTHPLTQQGLAKDLLSFCETSKHSVEIFWPNLGLLHNDLWDIAEASVQENKQQSLFDGSEFNFIDPIQEWFLTLPQLGAGSLLSCDPKHLELVQDRLKKAGLYSMPIGQLIRHTEASARITLL